ncbi:MAG TPA: hypothetical protein VE034_05960 [Burkholderiales bacterium]|nr:hypothetical protein [Burkholderiales bacterium]
MLSQRDLRKAVRHGERELRAAGGDMLSQLNPRNILRDARDLALKFTRDDVLQAYVAPRIWGALGVGFVFVLVSTVCSIDVMMRFARFAGSFRGLTLPFGALVWVGGVIGQIYVFAIWLEGLAARSDRKERGVRLEIPPGFLAYLKYSRALVPWILVVACVALPLVIMAPRAPIVALLLLLVSVIAPFLFRKIAA